MRVHHKYIAYCMFQTKDLASKTTLLFVSSKKDLATYNLEWRSKRVAIF